MEANETIIKMFAVPNPEALARRAGGDILKAKLALVKVFSENPETKSGLEVFHMKIDKVDLSEDLPMVCITFVATKDNSRTQSEFSGFFSGVWKDTLGAIVADKQNASSTSVIRTVASKQQVTKSVEAVKVAPPPEPHRKQTDAAERGEIKKKPWWKLW